MPLPIQERLERIGGKYPAGGRKASRYMEIALYSLLSVGWMAATAFITAALHGDGTYIRPMLVNPGTHVTRVRLPDPAKMDVYTVLHMETGPEGYDPSTDGLFFFADWLDVPPVDGQRNGVYLLARLDDLEESQAARMEKFFGTCKFFITYGDDTHTPHDLTFELYGMESKGTIQEVPVKDITFWDYPRSSILLPYVAPLTVHSAVSRKSDKGNPLLEVEAFVDEDLDLSRDYGERRFKIKFVEFNSHVPVEEVAEKFDSFAARLMDERDFYVDPYSDKRSNMMRFTPDLIISPHSYLKFFE